MQSLQSLKFRRRAVSNIKQITKAMEVVAATKMRRSQEVALRSRPYAFKVLDLLLKLSGYGVLSSPLAASREIRRTLVVIVASDRGLAGSFNAQVLRAAEGFFAGDGFARLPGHGYVLVAVGKRAENYATKKKISLVGKFRGFGDFVGPAEVEPLARFIIEGFLRGEWDRVVAISTHFRTALKQDVISRQVLPLDVEKIRETVDEIVPERGRYAELGKASAQKDEAREPSTKSGASLRGKPDYIFEPSPEEAINEIVPHLLKMQIYHLILEANASEHSARRVAMKNASDNADELSREITLEYNKARQAGITSELIEITATQSAMT